MRLRKAGTEAALHHKKFACIAPRLPGSTMAKRRKAEASGPPSPVKKPGRKRAAGKKAAESAPVEQAEERPEAAAEELAPESEVLEPEVLAPEAAGEQLLDSTET